MRKSRNSDPMFSAVAAHATAAKTFERRRRDLSAAQRTNNTAEVNKYELLAERAADAVIAEAWRLCRTPIKTLAGAIALNRCIATYISAGNSWPGEEWHRMIHEHLANSLARWNTGSMSLVA